ncbi:hypothetical protein LOZ66_003748 [Ophidiomyces ophidiicola]|nr:hypothetical protein LOZ66_003748 [Ophidiomyces ophidiicola]
MAHPTNEMADLHLQQSSEEDSWNSDTKHQPNQSSSNTEELPSVEEREQALRTELQTVRDINSVIEGVVESLERAKGNMENVSRTVSSASTLLDTWTRILSQTEHNQRLILNPSWQGATQDMADIENEALLKQQAAERRELEEQQRREALAQKAAEEERKRAATTVATNKNSISKLGYTQTHQWIACGSKEDERTMNFAPYQDESPDAERALSPSITDANRTKSPRSSPPAQGTSPNHLPSPSVFAGQGRNSLENNGNSGFGRERYVEAGRLDVSAFETSLPIPLHIEAMLAYVLLPPAGGVFLLLLEHKSDYVRYILDENNRGLIT